MKVFSINPNSEEYFEDNDDYVQNTDNIYQGTYNYTPVFPLYTFAINGRFNYENQINEIEFYTMLPIKQLFKNYLVEIRFRFTINIHEKDSLINSINEFNKFCENSRNTINVNRLI